MGALGDYVHLYWENYKKYGTSQSRGGRERKTANRGSKRIDFNKVHNDIRAAIVANRKIPPEKLKTAQRNYNASVQSTFEAVSDLANDKELSSSLLKALIKTAKLDKIFDPNDPQVVKHLQEILEFDIEANSLKLKEGKTFNQIQLETNKRMARTKKDKNGAEITKNANLGSLYKYWDQLKNEFLKTMKDPSIDADIKKSLKNLGIASKLIEIKKVLTEMKNFKEKEEKVLTLAGQKIEVSKITKNRIDTKTADIIVKALNNIRKAIKGTSYLNSFQFAFSEILTQAASHGFLRSIAGDLKYWLENLKGTLGTQTVKTNRSGNLMIIPDQGAMQRAADEFMEETDIKGHSFAGFFGSASDPAKMKIQVDYSQQQKADISIAIDTDEGGFVNVGASVKNINLNANAFSKDREKASINFQESSLLFYLIGMQQKTSITKNLGNHMLNVFANHPDKDSDYYNDREIANKSLALWILYSAISGHGQGFENQAAADILIIQPKGRKDIILFDVSSLVLDLENQLLDLPGLEAIKKISLLNNKVELKEGEQIGTNTWVRLTKLLMAARATRIKAMIPYSEIEAQAQKK